MTPRLTEHARERCAEMKISTKVIKRILRDPARLTYDATNNRRMALSPTEPDYAVVYVMDEGTPLAVTVVFRTQEQYVREGATFRPVPST